MTSYLTISNNTSPVWGLTAHDLQLRHPNTSFPQPLTPFDVADLGYLPVTPIAPPIHDAYTQRVVELPPVFDDAADGGTGAWVQRWAVQNLTAQSVADALASRKAALLRQIDAEVDATIAAAVGNRAQEYELAEREAQAYRQDGYPAANVPFSVQSDATAHGQTPRWSADRIVANASAWRAAQAELRAQRLTHKAQAKAAENHSALTATAASWATAIANIQASLN